MAAEAAVASPLSMKQSASLGSLIDAGASLSNRREALTVCVFPTIKWRILEDRGAFAQQHSGPALLSTS